MKSVYVGNLPYATTEAELKELFEQHGKVFGAKIKTDRDTGRPLGYGFVLLDDEEAPNVMQAMDGYNYEGRSLKVNESREREQTDRPQRRFDRGGNGERSFRPRGEFNNDFDGNMTERHHNYDDKRSHNKFRRDFERDDRPQRRRFNNSRNNFRDRDNDFY